MSSTLSTAVVNDGQTSQAFEPVGVGSPVGISIGGNASIVVEVYALGFGVTTRGQGDDLPRGERTLELEAYGKVFVFDPLNATQANWFVSPVESDVGSVLKAVKAVDQKHLPKVGMGFDGHQLNSSKTVILSLPQGMGKNALSVDLAAWLGCFRIVDEWDPRDGCTPGALHLTNVEFFSKVAA